MRSLVRPTERRIGGASGERHDRGAAAAAGGRRVTAYGKP
jgi:hypothetical protein